MSLTLQYKPFLEWDNRRSRSRESISIAKLRGIVTEAGQIHANLGNALTKIAKVLSQAETWMKKHNSLLHRCGVLGDGQVDYYTKGTRRPTLPEIEAAVKDAKQNVALDLEEAITLHGVAKRSQEWIDRSLLVAPKRSKRAAKPKWSAKGRSSSSSSLSTAGDSEKEKRRFTIGDIISLIEEAHEIPIDTINDVSRLQMQLDDVKFWQRKAQDELEKVSIGFQTVREAITMTYGEPSEYFNETSAETEKNDGTATGMANKQQNGNATVHRVVALNGSNGANNGTSRLGRARDKAATNGQKSNGKAPSTTSSSSSASHLRSASSPVGSSTTNSNNPGTTTSTGNANSTPTTSKATFKPRANSLGIVLKILSSLVTDCKNSGVMTDEETMVLTLEKVAGWCSKSLHYVANSKDVFEKRSFQEFDTFINDGAALLDSCAPQLLNDTESRQLQSRKQDDDYMEVDGEGNDASDATVLSSSDDEWFDLVSEQLERLRRMQKHRDQFIVWCTEVNNVLDGKDKRLTIKAIDKLAKQSNAYPPSEYTTIEASL